MKTPDITRAQIAAVLTFVVGNAVAWGWLPAGREQTIVAVGSIVIATAWKLADAWIRHGRSAAAAAQLVEQLAIEKTVTPTT